MADPRTLELLADWRTARDRAEHLERRWPLTRAVMWLIAVAAMVLLILGAPTYVPSALAIVALLIGGTSVLRQERADTVESDAWYSLGEHTGLDDASLTRFVEDGGAL